MALKKLMDAGGNLSLDVSGSASITSSPSTKVKSVGQGNYFGGMNILIAAGASNGTCTTSAPAPGTINGSASKVKSGGQAAVLDGDNVTVSGIPGLLGGGGACTLSVKVTANASQAKVKGQ